MNPRSQKLTIPLTSKIDLTRNKVDVSQFTDFEEKNSPVYGETLSPLYSKEVANQNYAVFDSKGHKFTYLDNILYKDDVEVMRTRGTGYFTIQAVDDPKDWDTYDKWHGHIIKSKYENGLIRYYYDNTEYRLSATSAASSIVACRSRILPSGVPITTYVLATTTANVYEFIFLSRERQGRYLTNTVMNGVWTSQSLLTPSQGGSAQNRSAAISLSTANVANNDKGFLNPLIQIAEPVAGVYVVSFISNHGGKIDANNEIRFFNMVWNGNTQQWFPYFNMSTGNAPTVDIPYNRNLSLSITPNVTKAYGSGTCYKYNIPSGDPAYDAAHQVDAGKYFTGVGQNNTLVNEIKFDEGYEPTWSYSVGTYYNVYTYQYHNDTVTINLQAFGVASGDYIVPQMTYTPKVKTTANEEQYDFNHIRYQTYSDDNLPIYTKSGNTYNLVYKKKLIPNSGTDKEVYTINDKTAYQYRPKWNSSFVDGSYLSNTNYYVYLRSGAANDPLYRLAQAPNRVIRRDIHSDVDKDGNPIPAGTILSYDQYPVCYTTEQAYHEATVGETWNGVQITTEAETYELDAAGNKIPANVTYWKQINGTADIYVPMSYEDVAPYADVPQTYASKSGEAAVKSTLYRTYFEIKYVTTWADGTPATFSSTFYNNGVLQWTYTYYNNYLEYTASQLWSGFNKSVSVRSKAGGAAEITQQTDPLNVASGSPVSWSHDFEWTVAAAATHATVPNVVLDDGSFVWVGSFTRNNFVSGSNPFVFPLNVVFAFQARADYMAAADTFHYVATGYYNTGVDPNTPGCVLTNTIDIGPNYYRTVLNMTNSTGSATLAPIGMQVLYDSATKTSYVDAGGLSSDATTGNGWYDAKYYNTQGSIAAEEGNWRYLYNSGGLMSGLSYGEDGFIGTLLTEWNSVADDKYVYGDENTIGWHSTDGRWYEVTVHENANNSDINIIFDRYVIVPTNGFWNCYDIEHSQPLHFASDFNNRVLAGVSQTKYTLDNAYYQAYGKTTGYSTTKMFVTGQNAMYEVSGVAITSIQISPQPYINICTGYENFIWCRSDPLYMPQKIEVFYGNTNNGTTADYQYSMSFYGATSIMTKDPNLVGLVSPVAISASTYYSPNIFTEFIKTYNNKDLVKNGSYGYPIVYSETTPILSYSSAKQLTGVDAVFVIQSQFYALIGGKIVSVIYDDYTIVGIDAIIDITGMKYLGYLPTKAYFWSQANRSLYSFTGDANLSLEMEANGISEVYETYYSTQKEALFIATDRGVYVMSDIQMYHIDTGIVKKIWFINDGYFIVEGVDNSLKFYSYEKDLIPVGEGEEVKKVPVEVETKYYGIGDGQVAVIDTVAMMFRSDNLEEGDIQLFCSTLTDVGFQSDTKKYHINAKQIDKLNNSFVINYVPKYCQGQGFKVGIKSDFPIVRITESMSGQQQNTSTSHNL